MFSKFEHEAVIKSCNCDVCGERAVGVEHVLCGTPVLFECRGCGPAAFRSAAETLVGRVLASLLEAA